MGFFYTICNPLSIIGKRFQDAGLRDLCIESGVIAEGSVAAGVMDGLKYIHAIRLHTLVYAVLVGLSWKGFLPWLELKHAGEAPYFNKAMKSIASLQDVFLKQYFRSFLSVNPVSTSWSCIKPICMPSEISITFHHSGCHILTWQ